MVNFICTSLRAPKAPDNEADMGHHEFKYAVFPHTGKATYYFYTNLHIAGEPKI